MFPTRKLLVAAASALLVFTFSTAATARQQAAQQTASATAQRTVGVIKSINGNAITLTTDAGADLNTTVAEGARLLRTAPGQQDLKDATPITLQDLQAGDRILIRAKTGDDGKTLIATTVIAMKQSDVAEKRRKDLQDWQRRGVGGLVKSVDPTAGAATISAMGPAGTTAVTVKVSNTTVIRRYSPDSVKFDDAKTGALADIKPGDQLRARGTKNADGTELTAEEIVSGTFRNISGLITAIDPAKQTVTVNDLATKKPVIVRITAESQMHKIPPMIAQRFAMRLKGETPQGASQPGSAPPNTGARPPMPQGAEATHANGATGNSGMRAGAADLQQVFARLPQMQFSELTKGEALMIVTTAGSATSDATAITLLSGVEPIITASNGSGAASLLAPWNLGAGGGEQGAQ